MQSLFYRFNQNVLTHNKLQIRSVHEFKGHIFAEHDATND